MRNKKNELQQIVDERLSSLQWDEWHSRAVMRKIHSQPARARRSLLPQLGVAAAAVAAVGAVILLALGKGKAQAIHDTVHGEIDPKCPASILKAHPNTIIMVDEAAGSML